MHPEENKPLVGGSLKAKVDFLNFLIAPFVSAGEKLLHAGMGKSVYAPITELLAPATPIVVAMGYAQSLRGAISFDPADDLAPLVNTPYLIVGAMVVHRIDRGLRKRRVHSGYTGRPLVLNLLPWLGERFVKGFVEPALLLGGGILAYQNGFNRPCSVYAAIVGASMFIVSRQRAAYAAWLIQRDFDAMEDAAWAAERFEELKRR